MAHGADADLLSVLQIAAQRGFLPAEAWACRRTVFAVAAEDATVKVHLYGDGSRDIAPHLDYSAVLRPATPAGVIGQLLRRQVASLVAEGWFSSATVLPLPSSLKSLKLVSVRGGFDTSSLPPSLTSLAVHISSVQFYGGVEDVDTRQAQLAALVAAAPPTLASLELDCFRMESLPQPLKLPSKLRELTLLRYHEFWDSDARPIGDTVLPSTLDTLTLEAYIIGPDLQLPSDLRTLHLLDCSLPWRTENGHPVLALPPHIEHLRITCEPDQEEYGFDGSLGPLPLSLRTMVIDHPEAAVLQPLPPCLEALELRDWRKRQRLYDALATSGGGTLQRLTLTGRSPRGSLRSAIGPLPAALTHFTCWLEGGEDDEDEDEEEEESGGGSDAQLPLLPQGLQELRINGVALPAVLPASLRLVRLGTDVDMSALEESLDVPGRRVEVGCTAHN
ncbi:hypothetical protein JKP88DRAFT_334919 [Tribonema minus]|uniref:Uncharacterized protein n=1 Tax=Tribonema minus TaxID=303371 RepID=A0A835YJH5_9STRA|nr:hypothetical protein JKP88DRAFT_334919 [Tribonema minus]